VIWKLIGGFLSGIVAKLGEFLAAYNLGKKSAENKALKNEIEAGRRIVEGQSDNSDTRDERVRDIKAGKRKL
jgi:hypothetical protein